MTEQVRGWRREGTDLGVGSGPGSTAVHSVVDESEFVRYSVSDVRSA